MFPNPIPYILRLIGLTDSAINLLNNILNVITGIQNLLGEPAQQHSVDDVLLDTDTIITELGDPTIGLAAILGEVQAQAVGILAAIAALPQTGDPVTLPTIPPAGYGGGDLVDIANAVWYFPQTDLPSTPADALVQIARATNVTGAVDFYQDAGILRISRIDWSAPGIYITSFSQPVFDPVDILEGETMLACLTRQNPTWTVSYPWAPQDYVGLDPTDGSQVHWITRFGEAGFNAYRNAIWPLVAASISPVWPGLARVTLGSPVAITPQMTVVGPMDGVIVEITAVTNNKPALAYDTELSYKFIGGIAFMTDNGDVEPFQPLGWTHAVYSPLRMSEAAGVVLRADPSLVGTITPWVIA